MKQKNREPIDYGMSPVLCGKTHHGIRGVSVCLRRFGHSGKCMGNNGAVWNAKKLNFIFGLLLSFAIGMFLSFGFISALESFNIANFPNGESRWFTFFALACVFATSIEELMLPRKQR